MNSRRMRFLHLWLTLTAILVRPSDWPSAFGAELREGLGFTNSLGIEFVWIPPGRFTMGSPTNEPNRIENEGPQTTVTISCGFWLGKYEVTQGEWLKLMTNNPSDCKGDLRLPVERVTWDEANEFCRQLTHLERTGGKLPPRNEYRLPTEAEWEYACRAGSTSRFSYGDDPGYGKLQQYAWYLDNSGHRTHPVGEKKPNPWGLHDIHGNVWEWCSDRSSYRY